MATHAGWGATHAGRPETMTSPTLSVGGPIPVKNHKVPRQTVFITTLSVTGLTGLLAAPPAVLLAGGLTAVCRVTV
jgi:hypothetical protein